MPARVCVVAEVPRRGLASHRVRYLQGEQTHCDEAQPRVEGIQVGDGRHSQVVRVEHRDDAHHDAGHGQQVQERVEQLRRQLVAAAE